MSIRDVVRYRSHPTRLSVAEAVEEAGRIGDRRTVLTRLSHEVDHHSPEVSLPPGVELGHDGREITIDPGP